MKHLGVMLRNIQNLYKETIKNSPEKHKGCPNSLIGRLNITKMEYLLMLMYKGNAIQTDILTYFFPPVGHYLPRTTYSDQAYPFKSLPRSESSELECIVLIFS